MAQYACEVVNKWPINVSTLPAPASEWAAPGPGLHTPRIVRQPGCPTAAATAMLLPLGQGSACQIFLSLFDHDMQQHLVDQTNIRNQARGEWGVEEGKEDAVASAAADEADDEELGSADVLWLLREELHGFTRPDPASELHEAGEVDHVPAALGRDVTLNEVYHFLAIFFAMGLAP
jgi:hypothetical protein